MRLFEDWPVNHKVVPVIPMFAFLLLLVTGGFAEYLRTSEDDKKAREGDSSDNIEGPESRPAPFLIAGPVRDACKSTET